MNKKYTAVIAAGLAIITLSSCGTKTIVVEKAPETTEQKTPLATVAPVYDSSTNFLNGLSYDYPSQIATLGKSKALEMGHLACGAIDEGATLADFARLASENNVDAGFIGALIREAVENFCPDNQWFIDSALNA